MSMKYYTLFAYSTESGDTDGVFYGMGKDMKAAEEDARKNRGMGGEWEVNEAFVFHPTKKEARELFRRAEL